MKRSTHDPYRKVPLHVPQVVDPDRRAAGRLRVLAFVDRYPPLFNAGAEWMLHPMLRHLVCAGHDVTVATIAKDPYVLDGVYVIPSEQVGDHTNVDVVVGHLAWTREVVQFCEANQLPLVYLMHNDKQIQHWTLVPENITAMVWNSEWVRDSYRAVWRGYGAVVRPPVFLDDYRIAGDPSGNEYVTLVNPNADKGAKTFYAVAAKHHRKRFLTVAGAYGTPIQTPLGNVHARPATPNMRGDVYSRTRVLCVPSNYESWGRVAIEACCAGIPVIAHPTPGLIEALGDAGIFRDREDVDAWCAALAMLDDPDAYAEWSRRARHRADVLDTVAHVDMNTWADVVATAAGAV